MAEVSEKKNTIIEIIIVIPSGEFVSKKNFINNDLQ